MDATASEAKPVAPQVAEAKPVAPQVVAPQVKTEKPTTAQTVLAEVAKVVDAVKKKQAPIRVGKGHPILTRRENLVQHAMLYSTYGHPALLQLRYSHRALTKDASEKIIMKMEKKGKLLQPGLNFIDSACYFVPSKFDIHAPATEENSITVHKFGQINCRPGSYMLLAAVEAIVINVLHGLVDMMSVRVDHGPRGPVIHKLKMDNVSQFLRSEDSPLLRYLSTFYHAWAKEVKYFDNPTGEKGKFTRTWLPLAIKLPDVDNILKEHQRFLVDRILAERGASMKKRGEALYKALADSGKLKVKAPKTEEEPKKESKKPKKVAVPASEFMVALTECRKTTSAATHARSLRPSENGYDPTPLLSQPDMINRCLGFVAGSSSAIAQISPEVRRFFDDMVNSLLIKLTNTAIAFMVTSKSATMSSQIALAAIDTFFSIVYGFEQSPIQRVATTAALEIHDEYQRSLDRKRKKLNEAKARKASTSTLLGQLDAAIKTKDEFAVADDEDEDEDLIGDTPSEDEDESAAAV